MTCLKPIKLSCLWYWIVKVNIKYNTMCDKKRVSVICKIHCAWIFNHNPRVHSISLNYAIIFHRLKVIPECWQYNTMGIYTVWALVLKLYSHNQVTFRKYKAWKNRSNKNVHWPKIAQRSISQQQILRRCMSIPTKEPQTAIACASPKLYTQVEPQTCVTYTIVVNPAPYLTSCWS